MYCFNRQWDNICIGRQYNNATQTTQRGPSWPHLCLCNECPVQNVNKSHFGESIILISLPFISVLYLFKHNTWHKTRDPGETKKNGDSHSRYNNVLTRRQSSSECATSCQGNWDIVENVTYHTVITKHCLSTNHVMYILSDTHSWHNPYSPHS